MFPKIGVNPPKWMVYFMENPIKMDDLGGNPIFGNTHFEMVTTLHALKNRCVDVELDCKKF